MPPNILWLEGVLQARIKLALAGLTPAVHVLLAADVLGVKAEHQLTPAVHVVVQDYRVLQATDSGRDARIEQTWLAVVVTRDVRNLATGADARQSAGALAAQVCAALMGFKPAGLARPLKLAAAPGIDFDAGVQYLPLGFTAELALAANPDFF